MSQGSSLYHRTQTVLPWSGGRVKLKKNVRGSVEWINGLRGVASFSVILTHLARAWDYGLFAPRDSQDARPRFLQWPVVRIPWQGRIGVTIFAFLTGYVCAHKPITLQRDGNILGAFTAIGKSAFRRPLRLMIPATIALLWSWTMAQCRAFVVANRSDCEWCRYAAPDLEDTITEEVVRLAKNFLSTWTTGYMAYDDHQWALLPLLKTSMLVYILTCAIMFMRFRWRMAVYLAMFLYYHQDAAKNTETFQMQGIYGMFLSDLSHEARFLEFFDSRKWPRRVVAALLAAAGLFIAGYPGEHPEWSDWSHFMFRLSHYIFPPGIDIGKRYTALGADLLILAIYISPRVQDLLCSRFLLWLGKQSFAVYLLHGTLLRTVLCWMLYGITGQPFDPSRKQEGKEEPIWIPIRPRWVVAISIPTWIVVVYVCATMWTRYVDPFCARLTHRMENMMCGLRHPPQVEMLPLARNIETH